VDKSSVSVPIDLMMTHISLLSRMATFRSKRISLRIIVSESSASTKRYRSQARQMRQNTTMTLVKKSFDAT
jgi:hypothetical protein